MAFQCSILKTQNRCRTFPTRRRTPVGPTKPTALPAARSRGQPCPRQPGLGSDRTKEKQNPPPENTRWAPKTPALRNRVVKTRQLTPQQAPQKHRPSGVTLDSVKNRSPAGSMNQRLNTQPNCPRVRAKRDLSAAHGARGLCTRGHCGGPASGGDGDPHLRRGHAPRPPRPRT